MHRRGLGFSKILARGLRQRKSIAAGIAGH
jgi:hypothetical protein